MSGQFDLYGFPLYEAFGQLKTLNAWARDLRCRTSKPGLYYRVHVKGLSVEEALKVGEFVAGRTITIKGRSQTIPQWAAW